MTTPDHDHVSLPDLYTAAADNLEGRHYVTFTAGPALWSAVHRSVSDMVTSPLVEGLRRHLRVDQVQHWDADQAAAVKVLREVADRPEQLDLLRVADAENRVAAAEATMREALGLGGEDDTGIGQLASWVADKFKRLEAEVQQLREASRRTA